MTRRLWHAAVALVAACSGAVSEPTPGPPDDDGSARIAWTMSDVRSPFASGGIASDGSAVFVYTSGLGIAAIRVADRTRLWAAPASETFDNGGNPPGLVVCGETVVFGSWMAIYGVDRTTGQRRWRWQASGALDGAVPRCTDGTVYVALGSTPRLVALDAVTGGERWTADLRRDTSRPIDDAYMGYATTPAISDGVVVTCTREFAMPFRGQAAGVEAATGRVLWRFRWEPVPPREWASCIEGPLVVDGTAIIAADDGRLFALDARTGATRWSGGQVNGFRSPGDERPLALAAGVLAAGSLSGIVSGYDPATGELRWTYGSRDDPAPTVVDSGLLGDRDVFICTTLSGAIFALDAATGRLLWRVQQGGALNKRIFRGPGVGVGDLHISIASDGLYAIRR